MYKIILNNKVIDIVQKPRFLKFLSSGNVAITDKTSANGIAGSDNRTMYSLVAGLNTDAPVVAIKEINEEEFNRLFSLLNSETEIIADTTELQNSINKTIDNLSQICANKIIDGFSVVLSDKNVYKFKLTAEDQLNLLNLENQLTSGEDLFIYHSTDMPCRTFRREDVKKIIKMYRKHLLYHTTYFNTAKHYIKTLTDIDKINNFYYGSDVVISTVTDPAIRKILLEGDVNR